MKEASQKLAKPGHAILVPDGREFGRSGVLGSSAPSEAQLCALEHAKRNLRQGGNLRRLCKRQCGGPVLRTGSKASSSVRTCPCRPCLSWRQVARAKEGMLPESSLSKLEAHGHQTDACLADACGDARIRSTIRGSGCAMLRLCKSHISTQSCLCRKMLLTGFSDGSTLWNSEDIARGMAELAPVWFTRN